MKKNNSPYTTITGCSYMFYEFERILPLLLDPDSEQLLKDEVENNQILRVNNRKARERFVVEFKRRFNSVPFHFWQAWQGWSETGKRAGLFYTILKTYKLVFDFLFNVAIRHWNSVNHQLGKSDIMMEFNEIAVPLMSTQNDFADNATLRFKHWLSVTFGEETLVGNLNFIEAALGESVDDYFVKDFGKDLKKMYQNRPIYWLFSSKKGAFQCIAYKHRMDAFTAERIRTKYLLPHIEWLLQKQSEMEAEAANLSARELKQLDKIVKQIAECREYHDRLHIIADKQISFYLDDGVVVNYAKFGDVLQKLK